MILALSLTLYVMIGSAQSLAEVIEIEGDFERISLTPELSYLPDPQEIYHITELVETGFNGNWQTTNGKNKLSLPAGLYWIKGILHNPRGKPVTVTLEVEYPSIHVADLYMVNNEGELSVIYNDIGLTNSHDKRPTPHRNIVNSIDLPPHSTTTLVWRIDSKPIFQFRATAWQPLSFFNHDQHDQILYGMLYGGLLVMGLYNLFLFASTREKSYYYYVLYVATAGYMMAADQGHLYQYLWTENIWSKMAIYALAYAVNLIMFGQFCIYFLDLPKRSPQMVRLIRYASVLAAISILLVAASNDTILMYLTLLTVSALYILALVAGIKVRLDGVISAGHFIIAIMILVFALITENMAEAGLIGQNNPAATENLTAIGTTLMLVFFSLALADRINQLKKENNEANIGISKSNEEKLKAQQELSKSQQERERLEQLSNQAEAESRAKSAFLATMSHEIRTPMNGVLGMAELLSSTHLDNNQQRYLNTIEHSGQTLLAIINDLQDFSKYESGKMELEINSFNLETLVDDCISTFALRAIEKNINFIADLSPSIQPVLKGDATKLRQVLLNLLNNAFKFTDSGNVLLRVVATEKPGVNTVELRFEIIDSGIGLSNEEQLRLFTPFQQADSSTYGVYGGSGLGLAISKRLVELMDGQIGVDSESGKGSCFWFTARFLINEHPESSLIRAKSGRLRDHRLLLVEPDKTSADIIQRLLSSWGMIIDCAESYAGALAAVSKAFGSHSPYSIILANFQLDDDSAEADRNNGIQLAKAILAEQFRPAPSFVLMATAKHLPNQSELSAAGIEIVLEKPITTALLHDVLLQAMIDPRQMPSGNNEASQLPPQPSISVLVVEDNEVNQMVIKGLLAKLNISPDMAENGLQALERFDEKSYQLILMDCEMPEMDGYEACKHMRSKEKHLNRSPAKIVALSAHARSDHQTMATEVGMNEFLTKPVTLIELQRVIGNSQDQS